MAYVLILEKFTGIETSIVVIASLDIGRRGASLTFVLGFLGVHLSEVSGYLRHFGVHVLQEGMIERVHDEARFTLIETLQGKLIRLFLLSCTEGYFLSPEANVEEAFGKYH